MNIERTAVIRNKLQASKTVLEMLREGKVVSQETIKLALRNLNQAIRLFDKFVKPCADREHNAASVGNAIKAIKKHYNKHPLK